MIRGSALLELINLQEVSKNLTMIATGEIVVAILELVIFISLAYIYVKTRIGK